MTNLTTKERLEISNKPTSNQSAFSILPLSSRSISGLSSSTLGSEPSTPTNTPTNLPSSFTDKYEHGNTDKSPTFVSQQRMSEGLIEFLADSPSENPPLPPRSKDMTRNEFNFNSPPINENISVLPPLAISTQNVISPRLPPRPSRGSGPPPIPTRHSKD